MDTTRRQFLRSAAALGISAHLPGAFASPAHTTLENQLNSTIAQMRTQGRISYDETIAIAVSDLSTQQKLVGIRDDIPMQCASMVKPLVIQAYLYCHYLKDAKIYPLNSKIRKEMRGMIVDSNNTFTNYIIKRLGGPQGVQWMLRKEAPNVFRDIQIVENIPAGGKTYRNKASASDYLRFMHALWYNQLPGSDFMKELMVIKNHDRISVRTKHLPQSARIYDKTGSTSMCCGNFGMIDCRASVGHTHPYTLSVIIEKNRRTTHYVRWITDRSNVIRDLSDQVYLYIAQTT